MMSGMRKPSPISISSPRETTTSWPRGQFVQRQIDGGGVVVDRDAGRAEQPLQQRAGVHVALAAQSGGEIVFEVRVSRWRLSGPSGARPRLVCRTTPVALMTRRSEGAVRARSARSTRASMAIGDAVGGARADLAPCFLEHPPHLNDHQLPRNPRRG